MLAPVLSMNTRGGVAVPFFDLDVARFWSKVDLRLEDECWPWEGAILSTRGGGAGYGHFPIRGHNIVAHRIAYELLVGRIPEGLTLDHECRFRACVNVLHLEPVTSAVNTLRGFGPTAMNARKTECLAGHELTDLNLYLTPSGRRQCRTCRRYANRRYRDRLRVA